MASSFAALLGLPQQQQNQQQSQSSAGGPSSLDRAQRSVFVGNIPYDATEEQLKDVFEQAGPVKSFRLVYDRESGKPKGYGFCEYQDAETAQSAMRNLNNVDFNGRPLRVGVAAGEQSKDDGKSLQQALGAQAVESPYGEGVEPEKAPEAISKAVASLPPEQMFELMKQMKLCIQNNPNEARNMLLQNPQLAYALLQAQIVMKIVDPQVAMSMLYRDETQPKVNLSGQQNNSNRPNVSQPQPPIRPQGIPAPMMNIMPMIRPPLPPHPDLGMMRPKGEMGDPRQFAPPGGHMGNPRPATPNQVKMPPSTASANGAPSSSSGSGPNISTEDQEKAALIMQVLQLTDEQIALLPPEQRQSILILKEQIKNG